jgi:hypothetical protein
MSPCNCKLALARLLPAALLCVSTVFPGCGDKKTAPGPDKESNFLPRTSPTNLLHNLKQAYAERDLAEYDSLLAEDFVFILSEEDQQMPDMPDSWGRDIEILIHTCIFGSQYLQTITLEYEIGDTTWDAEEGKYAAVIQHVNLYLYGSTPGHPTEVKEYRVSDGRSRFWFRKNGWFSPGTQNSVWTIVKWQDNPVSSREASGGVESWSWGALKALCR